MEPGEIILGIQGALAVAVALVYILRFLSMDKGRSMGEAGRLSQVLTVAASALILPFGCVLVYSAYDISALNWLKDGRHRLSFLILGIGAIAHAIINLRDNWPK